jgi:ribonuclease HI
LGPSVTLTAFEICSTPASSLRRASSLNSNCFAISLYSSYSLPVNKPVFLNEIMPRHNYGTKWGAGKKPTFKILNSGKIGKGTPVRISLVFPALFGILKVVMESTLKIYTDGGCASTLGKPGGWAYVMVLETFQGDKILAERWGVEKDTTNNRMELTAAIESLRILKTMNNVPRHVTIFTDSTYVQKGITDWINKWKCNSWRTSGKKSVKNQDLWMELNSLAEEFQPKWEWVPGHAGVKYNERCDSMIKKAIASIRGEQP